MLIINLDSINMNEELEMNDRSNTYEGGENDTERELAEYERMVEKYSVEELKSELESILSFMAENADRAETPAGSEILERYQRKFGIVNSLLEKHYPENIKEDLAEAA